MHDDPSDPSRRSMLLAGAWSAPIAVVAATTPLAVASQGGSSSLTVVTPQVASGEPSLVDVTFPESALPLTLDSATVTYTRLDATTGIGSATPPEGWTVETAADGGRVFRTSGDVSRTSFRFSVTFTGQGTWAVGFAPAEGGTFTGQIIVGTPLVD